MFSIPEFEKYEDLNFAILFRSIECRAKSCLFNCFRLFFAHLCCLFLLCDWEFSVYLFFLCDTVFESMILYEICASREFLNKYHVQHQRHSNEKFCNERWKVYMQCCVFLICRSRRSWEECASIDVNTTCYWIYTYV